MLAAHASGAAWPARCRWTPTAPWATLAGQPAPGLAAHRWRPAGPALCQRSLFSFCTCKAHNGNSTITCNGSAVKRCWRRPHSAWQALGSCRCGCAQSISSKHGSRDVGAHGLLASLWKGNFMPFCGTAAPGVHLKPLLRGPSTMPALPPRFSSLHFSSWMRLICAVTSSMPSSFTVYAQYRPESWILGSAQPV